MRSLVLGNSLRLGQCSAGKMLKANVIANFLWCPWTVEGGLQLLQELPLKQEKLSHRGPLEGIDSDPVELSLAFDEDCCIWHYKPSKV